MLLTAAGSKQARGTPCLPQGITGQHKNSKMAGGTGITGIAYFRIGGLQTCTCGHICYTLYVCNCYRLLLKNKTIAIERVIAEPIAKSE